MKIDDIFESDYYKAFAKVFMEDNDKFIHEVWLEKQIAKLIDERDFKSFIEGWQKRGSGMFESMTAPEAYEQWKQEQPETTRCYTCGAGLTDEYLSRFKHINANLPEGRAYCSFLCKREGEE